MKKIFIFLWIILGVAWLSGCDQSHRTMTPEISSGINREDLADKQEEMQKSDESSCVTTTPNDSTSSTPAMLSESETNSKEVSQMRIQVQNGETILVYELNDSVAAKELYEQLPLTLEVSDFSTNEKVFYPPEALDVCDAPLANADTGSLCYYAPWKDVVMFYDYFGEGNQLYELGQAISGEDSIEKLAGVITVTAAE